MPIINVVVTPATETTTSASLAGSVTVNATVQQQQVQINAQLATGSAAVEAAAALAIAARNEAQAAVASLVVPLGPDFTRNAQGQITRIDYDNGNYKTLTRSGGRLSQIDFVSGGTTIRKTFNYTDGRLASITQVTL